MPQVRHRFKLLLDENIPPRQKFPILNSRYDLKHLLHDLKRGGIEDPKVYDLAVKHERLIVTFNKRQFELMAIKSNKTGIISISSNVPNEQIDKKVTALLSKSKKGDLYGKFHYLTLP